jgi:hypothetical protein
MSTESGKTYCLRKLCAVLAVVLAFTGCQDSSTVPTQTRNVGSTPSISTSSGRVTQLHFVANGASGSVEWITSDQIGGSTSGELTVGRGGATSDPQTFLAYAGSQCDALYNCTSFRGEGTIPNEDLSFGLSGSQLHLSTNTSGNPNFTTFDGPTGLVTVDWKATGLVSQTISGTTKSTFAGLVELSQGTIEQDVATATGSVVGVPILPDFFATIGTDHTVSIDLTFPSP